MIKLIQSNSRSKSLKDNKLLKTNELVVDFRNHQIDMEFLKTLAEELNDTPAAAMIGHVILGDTRPFKQSKYLQDIENTLIANNAKYRQFPSDYIHCLLAVHCRYDATTLNTNVSALTQKMNQKNWKVSATTEIGRYKSTLYENESSRQLVLAFRGFQVEFKDYFEQNNQLETAIYGVLGI
jgi:hypothetical protein